MIKILLIIIVLVMGLTFVGCGKEIRPGSTGGPSDKTLYPISVETPNDVYYGPQIDDEEDIETEDNTGGSVIEPLTADVDTDDDADDDAEDEEDDEDDEEYIIFEDGPVPVYYGAEFFENFEDEEEFE